MLDLWQRNADIAAQPQPQEGRDLPATFGETFPAAWSEGQLFSDNLAHMNARSQAIDEYVAEALARGADVNRELSNIQSISGEYTQAEQLQAANAAVTKLKQTDPENAILPLSDDDLEQRAIAVSRQARTNYEQIAAREKTFGGKVGMIAGGLATTAADPINLAAVPVAPELATVLGSAMLWGTFGLVSQGINEGVNAPFRERVQPGYEASGAPTTNIVEAGLGGLVAGAGFKALGNVWTRVKTGAWPQSIRDAGNVVESETNIQQTNVLPGPQGEAAHRQALSTAVDQILNGQRVDVDTILATRALVGRMEREAPFTLPVINEPAIRLISEEAGLRSRAAELDTQLAAMPAGDVSAADRLNRLRAVEDQLATAATPSERAALLTRRDQILVDTTPEALRAAAGPLEERQRLGAERSQIDTRLDDIAKQRAQLTPTEPPPMTGQRMPVAPTLFDIHTGRIDVLMAMRERAGEIAEQAAGERAREVGAAQLPLAASTLDQLHEFHVQSMAQGVRGLADLSGYDMPAMEARGLADRIAGAKTDAEAMSILNQITDRPRTLADTLPSSADFARQAREEAKIAEATVPRTLTREQIEQTLASPAHEQALRADLDRARATADVRIPAGVDDKGEPIFRSLDSAMNEIDAYKLAGDEIGACAAPEAEEGEAA